MIRFRRTRRILRRWPAARRIRSHTKPAERRVDGTSTSDRVPAPAPAVAIRETRLLPIPASSGFGRRRSGGGCGETTRYSYVPLTVTDFHLRHEQLPFAYFFRETLDVDDLASSLVRVLAHYPVEEGDGGGGGAGVYIRCRAGGGDDARDTIPLSVGTTDVPLSRWLGEEATAAAHERSDGGGGGRSVVVGHEHESGTGHPTLLPLFDPLFPPHTSCASSDRDGRCFRNLIAVRITHCTPEAGGGTILGVNVNHALADAASCVRLVECWGREAREARTRGRKGGMNDRRSRSLRPRGASNDRSRATCSGMMSRELMDLLGAPRGGAADANAARDASLLNLVPDFAARYYEDAAAFCDDLASVARSSTPGAEEGPNEEAEAPRNDVVDDDDGAGRRSSSVKHEYVHLPFPPATLRAMKAHGMTRASPGPPRPSSSADGVRDDGPGYVSTNDMVTAAGWSIKRRLSGRADWNVSMIVNLRGRGGVHDFADVDATTEERETDGGGVRAKDDASKSEHDRSQKSPSLSKGVFGNGITNVVATQPPASIGNPADASIKGKYASIEAVSSAAVLIRRALATGLDGVADRIANSRMGRGLQPSPTSSPPVGGGSSPGVFSTTSWGAFSSLWDIRFSPHADGRVMGFHAHPSHPLPSGNTFSSVIVPTKSGGCVYKLLLPSHLARDARILHRDLCASFLDWNVDRCA